MDLKALLLTQGVIVATCLSTFVAARQLEPEASASSASASSSSSSLCSRALATTLWGAAFAFFSLLADAWPASKSLASLTSGGYSLSQRLRFFFVIAPFAPLFGISLILNQMFTTLTFRIILGSLDNAKPDTLFKKLRKVINDILSIFGFNQQRRFKKSIRFIATTSVVLGMSDSTKFGSTPFYTEYNSVKEDIMGVALTLGQKTDEHKRLVKLHRTGKLALLESGILPNYKQLQFVDGRSGIATFIIFVQAIDYVISIVYRAILYLPVSPIEAIGFAFSMLVIVHSLVHRLGVICQNPLVIYLNPTKEQEMLDKCKAPRWTDVHYRNCANAATVGMVVVGSVVVAFTIFVEWHVLRISWLDATGPILFLLSFITQFFSNIILPRLPRPEVPIWIILFLFGSAMISFCGIVVSIVATLVNWQTNKFDIRTPSVIHTLPFLG